MIVWFKENNCGNAKLLPTQRDLPESSLQGSSLHVIRESKGSQWSVCGDSSRGEGEEQGGGEEGTMDLSLSFAMFWERLHQ